jgi:Bifunctional DNA primase/polymerase, N-terminal
MMNAPSQALQALAGEAFETLVKSAKPAASAAAAVAPAAAPHDPSPFERNAMALAARGLPVIPLRPMTKVASLTDWPELATTDKKTIQEWGETYPEANVACVAKLEPRGFWFFEVDAPNFHQEIQKQTGQKMPLTMAVTSRKGEGRGHFYFRHTPASLAMGNIEGKDAEGHETWSARADNKYVVGPGSIHPTTLRPYQVIIDAPIAEAPDWLVEWLLKNKHVSIEDKERVNASPDGPPIPRGSHDNTLFKIACSLRNSGLGYDSIREHLISVCEKRCVGYGADYVDMCEKKAASACKYPVGEAKFAYVGSSVRAEAAASAAAAEPEIQIPVTPYPVFPLDVMRGTSIYEGLVKPVCDANSRYPEFMFMPAITVLLNYLGGKVKIKDKNITPSIFLCMIGRKGRVIKSSSAQDAFQYLQKVGICAESGIASGRTMLFRPGSAEGLGKSMLGSACSNALLFYDELNGLVGKAGIESSSLASNLLTLYESGFFANQTKQKNDNYAFPAGAYTASLIACTTETDFNEQWSRLSANHKGMDERWFFLYQPETLMAMTPHKHVDTMDGVLLTHQRIADAVAQGTFEIENSRPLEEKINEIGNRTEIRAEKFALAFAVDLGKKSIDDDCIERGLALAKYERDVKRYLGGNDESVDALAVAQNKFCRVLQRHLNGTATMATMQRDMNYRRYNTEMWQRIVNGLSQVKRIQVTPGKRKDQSVVQLLEAIEFTD